MTTGRKQPPQTAQFAAAFPQLDAFDTEVREHVPPAAEPLGARDRAGLTLLSGSNAGQFFSIDSRTSLLGRDLDADIRLDDTAISRKHARIVVHGDGRYILEDLGSANGTFVGGTRIKRHELLSGDRIQLGPSTLVRFALLDETEEMLQRQLFESSIRDPLTRAHNKAYFAERLDAELAHARRHKGELAIIVFDLDLFKRTNDVYGHLVGDLVLRTVADRVHALIRVEDVFARFGGEEFVIMIRGQADAVRLAERLRAAIEELAMDAEGRVVKATVSVGVASLGEFGPDVDATHVLRAADDRLLRAKREGRNRVCASDL
ncbi:MAG: GGDEF domain-containing protein [Myxococcota bacterium]|nr:GGDEF domain-containing protein [Myxococcota bacterium]